MTGVIDEFPLPLPTRPLGITAGPDGNLWYTAIGRIGRITLSGTISEFALDAREFPTAITAGPDNALWYSLGDGIGRITTGGQSRGSTSTRPPASPPARTGHCGSPVPATTPSAASRPTAS